MIKYFTAAGSLRIASLLKVSCYWVLFIILLLMTASQSGATFSRKTHIMVYAATGPIIAVFITWVFIKLEKKSFAAYGLNWRKDTLLKFFKGMVIGTASYLIIVLILVLFAGLKIERNPDVWHPLKALWYLLIIPLAFMEEIAFRSYPFFKLNSAFELRLTQLIIPFIFAIYHIALGWNIHTAFLGPGIWAVIFGVAAFSSRGIALPTGLHVALNLSQAILGMNPSEFDSVWVVHQNKSDSIAIVGLTTRVMVLIVGVVLTEFYVRRHQNQKKQSFARGESVQKSSI